MMAVTRRGPTAGLKRSAKKHSRPRPFTRSDRKKQLDLLRDEASTCRRCDLWRYGTQTVFGEGPVDAELMLVGEQPGDVEDIQGRPFVGPAGRILHEALTQAGLSDTRYYLTNAVKHFKWEPRGKRRIHVRPNTSEVLACSRWLEGEIAAVRPRIVVALGATAVRALLGPSPRVLKNRGHWLKSSFGPEVLVTVHPSSVLRVTDRVEREAALSALVDDLRQVTRRLRSLDRPAR
jgi:uracil-DNA glycosylase